MGHNRVVLEGVKGVTNHRTNAAAVALVAVDIEVKQFEILSALIKNDLLVHNSPIHIQHQVQPWTRKKMMMMM